MLIFLIGTSYWMDQNGIEQNGYTFLAQIVALFVLSIPISMWIDRDEYRALKEEVNVRQQQEKQEKQQAIQPKAEPTADPKPVSNTAPFYKTHTATTSLERRGPPLHSRIWSRAKQALQATTKAAKAVFGRISAILRRAAPKVAPVLGAMVVLAGKARAAVVHSAKTEGTALHGVLAKVSASAPLKYALSAAAVAAVATVMWPTEEAATVTRSHTPTLVLEAANRFTEKHVLGRRVVGYKDGNLQELYGWDILKRDYTLLYRAKGSARITYPVLLRNGGIVFHLHEARAQPLNLLRLGINSVIYLLENREVVIASTTTTFTCCDQNSNKIEHTFYHPKKLAPTGDGRAWLYASVRGAIGGHTLDVIEDGDILADAKGQYEWKKPYFSIGYTSSGKAFAQRGPQADGFWGLYDFSQGTLKQIVAIEEPDVNDPYSAYTVIDHSGGYFLYARYTNRTYQVRFDNAKRQTIISEGQTQDEISHFWTARTWAGNVSGKIDAASGSVLWEELIKDTKNCREGCYSLNIFDGTNQGQIKRDKYRSITPYFWNDTAYYVSAQGGAKASGGDVERLGLGKLDRIAYVNLPYIYFQRRGKTLRYEIE